MESQEVIFKNKEDYLSRRNKMYDNIKETIIEWIIKDKFEYEHMSYQGLTPRQRLHIEDSLRYELKKFTEHKCDEWCDNVSFNIILGIRGFLDGLSEIKRITDFTAEEYAKLIHNSIIYQLDNDKHSPCLLDDIRQFPNDISSESE
jgi:hypothetical protein